MADISDQELESESSDGSNLLNLSCSFSSVDQDYENHHSEAGDEESSQDEIGTVEPYLYEPEEPSQGSESSASSSESDGEGPNDDDRIGNTDWLVYQLICSSISYATIILYST